MFSRRRFIRIGAASVGSLALRNFGVLPAMAQSTSGYKALVCVFLYGGNDSNNTIIPADSKVYGEYTKIRANLALAPTDLTQVAAKDGSSYYFHGNLKDLAGLFSQGHLAVAANVGPLVQPITSRAQLTQPSMIPGHLFSHSDQQFEWQTSDSSQQTPFGWAGRTADQLLKNNANVGTLPPFISVTGNNVMGNAQISQQLQISPGGSLGLTGYDATLAQARSKALNSLLTTETGLSLVNAANGVLQNSIADAQILGTALKGTTVTTVFPNTGLGSQLKQVAQIIKARTLLNMQRQVFFCSLGGFDTHTNQIATHKNLYPQLNDALLAFFNSMNTELGIGSDVTLFTESDFSRTFVPSTGAGSDHAWGSHHMVMGGAVTGQKIYNTFPQFVLGSNNDFDTGSGARGRWIPTASVDQYGASLVQWFGVDPNAVFPNLAKNFPGTNPFSFFS